MVIMRTRVSGHRIALAAVVLAAAVTGCTRRDEPSAAGAIRLVDTFQPAFVRGKSDKLARTLRKTEWRFDGAQPNPWVAGPGVAALTVREGRLSGRASAD